MKETLGGGRIGSGNEMEVELHGWGKSTHNLKQKLITTISAGTLVPFLVEPVLPGDEWKVKVYADLMTEATNGAMFGSFKYQADFYFAPLRLYIGKMHNNKLNVATSIDQLKLPLLRLRGRALDTTKTLANQQVHVSSIMSYLGTRGLGRATAGQTEVRRDISAVEYLTYLDIFKNYYANKQETNAYVIHSEPQSDTKSVVTISVKLTGTTAVTLGYRNESPSITGMPRPNEQNFENSVIGIVSGSGQTVGNIMLILSDGGETKRVSYEDVFTNRTNTATSITSTGLEFEELARYPYVVGWDYAGAGELTREPQLKEFPIANIDLLREEILTRTKQATPIIVGNEAGTNIEPITSLIQVTGSGATLRTSLVNNQEGLLVKTYQSDIFNNWLKTDIINQINNASAISIVNNMLFVDQINMAKKVYEHYNRLAVTSGTYKDYIRVTYGVEAKDIEIPMYLGGLSKEVVFQEVVSSAETADKPLGTIGGRGTFNNKNKGGYIELKSDEEWGTLMGILSITPRLVYSDGNKWYNNLKTVADYHIPAMDGIGFQDLITDQMAYWDTQATTAGVITTYSAGKQPAWTNYMTSYDRALGRFADEDELSWMVLGRKYTPNQTTGRISDLTTYIDPAKFNYVFAVASRDAQNFWTEIVSDITVRRVMSAKQIPTF